MRLTEVGERMDLLDGIALLPGRELPINEETGGKVGLADEGLRLEFVREGSCRHPWVGVGVLKRGRSSQFIAIKYSSECLGVKSSYPSMSWVRGRDNVGRDIRPNSSALTPLIEVETSSDLRTEPILAERLTLFIIDSLGRPSTGCDYS